MNQVTWNKQHIQKPLLIAGPCSAESETQVLDIAASIKDTNIAYYRAGIWKPRTSPYDFEGVGRIGLKWLQSVQEIHGLKVATEVANAQHVEQCLEAGIDMLWIGARSTTSPFTVQEIADALKGVQIPIMIKNPVNPDTKLWIGGVKRLINAGIQDIAVIHRGFSVYEKKKYRNEPHWQIPLDLQKEFPNMPIICDPSHISGNRAYIYEISQKALDFNFDGLMIETHNDPDNAYSDAAQQVLPEEFKRILNQLIIRQVQPSDYNTETLDTLRNKIRELDEVLLTYLNKRMDISAEIGKFKLANNMVIFQQEVWETHYKEHIQKAMDQFHLSENFASELFKIIHQESIKIQQDIFLGNNSADC